MALRFYVASSIKNKEKVQEVFDFLSNRGHQVTTDWTLTDDIPEEERDTRRDYIRTLAKRDFEGIRESDVFVMLSEPSEGRSMYVELGVALASHDAIGRPAVFVLGSRNNESVFYFLSSVQRVGSLDDLLTKCAGIVPTQPSPLAHAGRLEEYKALRAEMLEIIKDRIWGQATYAVFAAGLLALTGSGYRIASLIFLIGLAIPFLFHTMFREHARIRMGNYLRVVVEPRLPGMYWEEYLGLWRGRFGKQERQGWLNAVDRTKHIFSLSGLYLLASCFCWFLLLNTTNDLVPTVIGSVLLIALLVTYRFFYKLYDKGAEEYEELLRVSPRG
jgi:hypothetical protein